MKNISDLSRTFEKILDVMFKSGVERKKRYSFHKKGTASIKKRQLP
jgi:hypothetical protein